MNSKISTQKTSKVAPLYPADSSSTEIQYEKTLAGFKFSQSLENNEIPYDPFFGDDTVSFHQMMEDMKADTTESKYSDSPKRVKIFTNQTKNIRDYHTTPNKQPPENKEQTFFESVLGVFF